MRSTTFSKGLMYFVIAVIVVVYLYPLLYTFNISLKTSNNFMLDPVGLSESLHWKNYLDAWKTGNFGNYIMNSFIYTILVTVMTILLNIFLAFPIARQYIRGAQFLTLFMLAAMFLPDGTIPLFQLFLKMNLYNTSLGYIITLLSIGGLTFYFFVSYIKAIPKDFDEACAIDGCGYLRYMFMILMPLMKPAIATMIIFNAMNVWNDIIRATIFLSNDKLYPITKGLFVFFGVHNNNWTVLTAALIIVSLPITAFYLTFQRYIVDGALAGAVKS
ncbi:carbohydrate ABC transporter permease [Cohnella abietis]|uniref:sn-glycerol-3-phosphate transport system permease protein UgpE n=1 Tax=Cohnella abietis TaxID=2507935 RepID=A0A3T1D1I1_9BACL|nr:carbohydrate ABC transporter permease [Cohnella abietis]BBI31944.1 sn-glycerol-3-phosphate transport system permease protein UgpE [Cohnella abietis]